MSKNQRSPYDNLTGAELQSLRVEYNTKNNKAQAIIASWKPDEKIGGFRIRPKDFERSYIQVKNEDGAYQTICTIWGDKLERSQRGQKIQNFLEETHLLSIDLSIKDQLVSPSVGKIINEFIKQKNAKGQDIRAYQAGMRNLPAHLLKTPISELKTINVIKTFDEMHERLVVSGKRKRLKDEILAMTTPFNWYLNDAHGSLPYYRPRVANKKKYREGSEEATKTGGEAIPQMELREGMQRMILEESSPVLFFVCMHQFIHGNRIGETLGMRREDLDINKMQIAYSGQIISKGYKDLEGNYVEKRGEWKPRTKTRKNITKETALRFPIGGPSMLAFYLWADAHAASLNDPEDSGSQLLFTYRGGMKAPDIQKLNNKLKEYFPTCAKPGNGTHTFRDTVLTYTQEFGASAAQKLENAKLLGHTNTGMGDEHYVDHKMIASVSRRPNANYLNMLKLIQWKPEKQYLDEAMILWKDYQRRSSQTASTFVDFSVEPEEDLTIFD